MSKTPSQPNDNQRRAPAPPGRTILLYLLALLLALGAFLLWMYHGISPVIHGEYGMDFPPADSFCSAPDAAYYPDEACRAIGAHVVNVQTRFRVVPCLLIVKDTTAPTAVPVALEFPSGYVPAPQEFITDLQDADLVGVSFAQAYDFSDTGIHQVAILLEDMSGNQRQISATATVRATVEKLTLEAGSPVPTAEDFCTPGFHGELLTPLSADMMRQPGEYALQLKCVENGKIFPSILSIRDTVSPTAAGTLLVLQPGEEAAPERFVTEAADETQLTYSFALAPDPQSREIQNILIEVTDAGGNAAQVPAQVLYSAIGRVTVEAKNGPLTGADLGVPAAEPEAFLANEPGTYAVRVRLGDEEQIAMVTLVDTTAPALALREGPFYTHHDLSPEDLVSVEDVTEVTLRFLEAPDQTSAEQQTFRVKAVDAAGNEAEAAFPLTLLVDSDPPVLYGVVNRSGYVGEPIVYLKEVYAQDDIDGRVDVQVESSVILSQRGKYTVIFTAADASGNTVSKSCTYTLVAPTVSDERVREAARQVLSDIITPDMVTAEKLKAVFDYVRARVHYTGNSDKTDWRKEAIRGFEEGRGDCFTVYSTTRALLDELDIPYMSVTRKSTSSRHFWVIVNIGTGWYHFDPLISSAHRHRCFMWTNQQCKVKPYFWRFHEENFPPIATDPFNYDAVVQMEREGLLP